MSDHLLKFLCPVHAHHKPQLESPEAPAKRYLPAETYSNHDLQACLGKPSTQTYSSRVQREDDDTDRSAGTFQSIAEQQRTMLSS